MDERYPLALPQGTVLAGQYILEKVIGQGGFGITYAATDHKTGEKVAVKEFFPDAMATRTNQTTVMPFSGERGESYGYGKTCFLQEAETLAQFIGNENIVRIRSYFEENGTAYFVMDYVEGISFDTYIKEHGGKVSWEDAARILVPVMDALGVVHSRGIIHRDVAPDNIYITKDGTVKLLDFGAARYSLGDKSRSLDVILKHGFAPKEQYTRRGKQGPFTDVYSLGATFYFALTGKRPQDSVERMDEDDLVPPSALGVQIGKEEEDAILKALNVQPQERFQSMAEFKRALMGAGQPVQAGAAASGCTEQRFFTAPEQPAAEGQTGGMQPSGAAQPNGGQMSGAAQPGNVQLSGMAQPGGVQPSGIVPPTGIQPNGGQIPGGEGNSGQQPGGAWNVGAGPAGAGNGKKPGKKVLIAAAAAVVVVLVAAVMLFAGGRDDKEDPVMASRRGEQSADMQESLAGTQESVAVSESAATPEPEFASTLEPTAMPEPQPTAVPEPTAAPVGDLTILSDVNAVKNGGLLTSWNGRKTFVSDDGYSLTDTDGKYWLKPQEKLITNLTEADDKLYFLYGDSAYALTSDNQLEKITVLNDRYGGNITCLLITKDYYIVCIRNKYGTGTVCRVAKDNGDVLEYCTVERVSDFTISDGWLYYITREDGLACIHCMRLTTAEKDDRQIQGNNTTIDFGNVLARDGYLYYIVYRTDDPGYCTIERWPMDFVEGAEVDGVWNIGSKIKVYTASRNCGFDIRRGTNHIYFYAPPDEDAEFPDLYQIKANAGGTFEASLIAEEAYAPCITGKTNSDNYDLNYHHRTTDADGVAHVDSYYVKYDADGNVRSE